MYDRVMMVFKAMIDALLGKVEDPQLMLENTYQELQSALIATRKELAKALATEAQLKERIRILEKRNLPTEGLQEKLKQLQVELSEIRRRLDDLENGVQKAYTKKQVLIARDRASGGALLVCEEILVGKAITDDGRTFDREIAPATTVSKDARLWTFLIIALLIVIALIMLAQSFLVN